MMLSRLQFAFTSMFHFVFVPLTLGLSVLLAWMEWRYVKTNDEKWLRMSKFWGKLFLINFAVGIVTGITLEFQFGMNWAEYSKYVGDIFGAPLAIEATVAFFLESVFIGVWIFGWDRVSKKMHALAITIVAFATNLSALWILLANGWMQNPVGATVSRFAYESLPDGTGRDERFHRRAYQPLRLAQVFPHDLRRLCPSRPFLSWAFPPGTCCAGMKPISSKAPSKLAAWFGLASCILVIGIGDMHGADVARLQPTKLAAMESVWETSAGRHRVPADRYPRRGK